MLYCKWQRSDWHCLGPVKDYQDGKPHSVEVFGTKLVVFADSHGDLKILDGYCRHMGGDLSQGTIKGDEVACPFHDWRWGGDGKCKLVPYAKRTPRLARTRAWHTDIRSGLLFQYGSNLSASRFRRVSRKLLSRITVHDHSEARARPSKETAAVLPKRSSAAATGMTT